MSTKVVEGRQCSACRGDILEKPVVITVVIEGKTIEWKAGETTYMCNKCGCMYTATSDGVVGQPKDEQ